MGSLALPDSGVVYADTQVLIYSIERIAPYFELLLPLWEASECGQVVVATSELAVLEVMVAPLRRNDERLIGVYDELLQGTEIQTIPIAREILREAARLRAETSLRTPDAIHAATALSVGCSAFITNDAAFRVVGTLPVQLLSDLSSP